MADIWANVEQNLGNGGGLGGVKACGPGLPPKLAEKYERLKVVGKGSFGQAVLVRCLADDIHYIVKEVDMSSMSEKERRDSFNEISVLSKLNHPNIIKYHESCQHGAMLYIVMEYADGGDLWQLGQAQRKKGGLTEEQVLSYFIQICLALQHMHGQRMLHRDLKTGNVFLTNKKRVVKLGDFGISTALRGTVAYANTVCGTPNYFSPELVQNKPYNNKSDVWAVGCILYEMMSGQVAFQGRTMMEIYQKIIKGQLAPLPSHYSKELRGICARLLSQNQAMRPDINATLRSYVVKEHLKNLQDLLNGQKELEPPPPAAVEAKAEPEPEPEPTPTPAPAPEPAPKQPEQKADSGKTLHEEFNIPGPDLEDLEGLEAAMDAILEGRDLPDDKKTSPIGSAALRAGPPQEEAPPPLLLPSQPNNDSVRMTQQDDIEAILGQLGTIKGIEGALNLADGDAHEGGYQTFGDEEGANFPPSPEPVRKQQSMGGNQMTTSMEDIINEELGNI